MKAKDLLPEKWSEKYKRSINCSNPKGFSQKAHCAGRKKNEDRHVNEPPVGPETKPTMPKGTLRVDVSDVYDWYKLGMHIANLKGLGKHDFGKGPPSTIISFGSEDLEHQFIQDLLKTGLTTTDIDPADPNQPPGMKPMKTDPTFNVEGRKKKRKSTRKLRGAAYGPGPYGLYGYYPGYSGDGGSDGMNEGQFRANDVEEFKPSNDDLNDLKSKYLPDWEMLDHRTLQAKYVADDHRAAVAFVKIINMLSEKMDHFCEVTQDVAEVTVKTSTFDVKGLTLLDFQIAMVIDRFANDVGIKQMPMSGNFGMHENFADGKKPGRKGLAKRSGVNCKQSVTKLRSVAKNSSGEKARMAHWCANMKSGRNK